MDDRKTFGISFTGYVLRILEETDITALQNLFEKCSDYFWIVDGTEVAPTSAEETFYAGPPGKSLEDKFLFGLFDLQGNVVVFLEGFKDYPNDTTWWIGLLMLDPFIRGQGIGRKLIDSFTEYVDKQGGMAIRLGVVEDNKTAYDFWQRVGFTMLSKTEPRAFGRKVQSVYVMQRTIHAQRGQAGS